MDFLKGMVFMALVFMFILVGLKAYDSELERNEQQNKQWVKDVKDNKPFTNYGE